MYYVYFLYFIFFIILNFISFAHFYYFFFLVSFTFNLLSCYQNILTFILVYSTQHLFSFSSTLSTLLSTPLTFLCLSSFCLILPNLPTCSHPSPSFLYLFFALLLSAPNFLPPASGTQSAAPPTRTNYWLGVTRWLSLLDFASTSWGEEGGKDS